jgi:asparagine synthase (glutamine-hydrolysing)
LRGYTFVYDRLLPDDERHYAGLAARAIEMPIEFWPIDDYVLYERCFDYACQKPEPYHWPLEAAALDLYRRMAGSSRVALTGEGGDPLSYFGSLLCTPRFHRLLPDAAAYALSRRRCPPLGLRTTARRMLGSTSSGSGYPQWLNDGFATRMELPARFEQVTAEAPAVHPTHARAHAMLSSSLWPAMFEGLNPGTTRIPLEFRHPIFDVRLIEYVLAIPLIPWSVDKELLRSVSMGVQPDEVRLRRKSPLGGDPIMAHLHNGRPAVTDALTEQGRLPDYVNLEKVRRALDETSAERWWTDLRPVSLNVWLNHV